MQSVGHDRGSYLQNTVTTNKTFLDRSRYVARLQDPYSIQSVTLKHFSGPQLKIIFFNMLSFSTYMVTIIIIACTPEHITLRSCSVVKVMFAGGPEPTLLLATTEQE